VPPLRIDILTSIAGISFGLASANALALEVEGRRVPVIGLDALLANKRAVAERRIPTESCSLTM
jgi:hypothetical protein